MAETPSSIPVSTRLLRIATLARQAPQVALTTLAHHMDMEWLHEAYRRTRKDGAVGVDGQTAEEYAVDLEDNLQSLLARAKCGTYRAPPVRRVHIPKGDGKSLRPLGIPTFEDKVLQRAVAMLLEAVYEQDFLPCSYGFRPGRSAHQALDVLWHGLMDMHGGWVVEVDIQSFFNTLDHRHLQDMLRRRVRDGVLLRLIGKWLKAGVLETGQLMHPEAGTPQGGVVSPVLANVYLHEVFDTWFAEAVMPRLYGRALAVRYADDIVLVFSREDDARRVMDVLPKRFGKYGLTLHPEKTRLVRFGQPRVGQIPSREMRPGTFDVLGFTHFWGRTRKGTWVVRRKTAKGRFQRAVRRVWEWCRGHRHHSLQEQQAKLTQKLLGHCGYYGVTGNVEALFRFRKAVQRAWKRWLARRSQRGEMSWGCFYQLLKHYPLPRVRVVHSIYTT